MKTIPKGSCAEGMTLSSLNISCGIASKAQAVSLALSLWRLQQIY